MQKYVLAGLLGLMALLCNEAHAQIIITRPSSPLSRPGYSPYYGPGYGNQLFGGPLSGGLFGGPRGGLLGVPTQQGFAPGTVYPAGPTGRAAPAGVDQDSPLVTGHPTRFAAYAGYFSNQGGGGSATPPAATPASRVPAFGALASGVATQPTGTPATRGRATRTPRR